MVRVELHIDSQDDPDAPARWLTELRQGLQERRLTTEQCEFHLARNSPELVRSCKESPFIRLVITQRDRPGKIVSAIRKFLPQFDGLGIDIVTMPIFVQPGMGWHGRQKAQPRWYNPADPLCATRHATTTGDDHGQH